MRKRDKSKLMLLLILSIVTISGCSGAPKFPSEVRVWETAYLKPKDAPPESPGEWFCGEYKVRENIKSAKDIKFDPVKDHDIRKCVGSFGFKNEDFPKVLDWMTATEKYYKDKLKSCEGK